MAKKLKGSAANMSEMINAMHGYNDPDMPPIDEKKLNEMFNALKPVTKVLFGQIVVFGTGTVHHDGAGNFKNVWNKSFDKFEK